MLRNFTRSSVVRKSASAAAVAFNPKRSFYEWRTSTAYVDHWTNNDTLKTWIVDRLRLLHVSGLVFIMVCYM
jgi:hypothetical protein